MDKLHSVEGAGTSKVFGSLRLFGLSCLVATAGMIGAPALAQATCAFDDPADDDQLDADERVIEFVSGDTGADATVVLPGVSDTNAAACSGEGDMVYTLYKGATKQTVATGANTLVLLTLMDAEAEADRSNIAVETTGADANTLPSDGTADPATGATVTYTAATTPGFHNAAPESYTIRAQKSGGTALEYTFTVTIKPSAHADPTLVEAAAETANSIYVEWLGDGNPADATADPVVMDTTATKYEIYVTTGTGSRMKVGEVDDMATGISDATPAATNPKHSFTITDREAGTAYTVEVRGVSGSSYSARASGYVAAADPDDNATVTTKPAVEAIELLVGAVHDDTLVSTLVEPRVDTDATEAAEDSIRFGETFEFSAAAMDETVVSVHYLDGEGTVDLDGDGTAAGFSDDKISIEALANGETDVTVTGTGSEGTVLTGTVKVTVSGLAEAPSLVMAISETDSTIYVEWTGDGNNSDATSSPATSDTSATAYEIYVDAGEDLPSTPRMTVDDTATGITADDSTGSDPRQSATITNIDAVAGGYNVWIIGVSGAGADAKRSLPGKLEAKVMIKAEAPPVRIGLEAMQDISAASLVNPSIGGNSAIASDNMRFDVTFTYEPTASSDAVTATFQNQGTPDDPSDDEVRIVGNRSGEHSVTLTATGSDGTVLTGTVNVNVAGLAEAPSDVHAAAETATSIYVEWTGDGTAAEGATQYRVAAMPTTSGMGRMSGSVTVMDTATATDNPRQSATVTGLTAGTEYSVTVTGVSGTGDSIRTSDTAMAATTVTTLDMVGPFDLLANAPLEVSVADLIVPSVGDGTAMSDAMDNVRHGVTFTYAVAVAPQDDDVSAGLSDDNDEITVSGTAEGSYTLTLTATGSDSTVLTASIDFTIVGLGTAPTAVRAIAETMSSIYVEWTGDGSGANTADRYVVTATPNMGDPRTATVMDTATATDNPRQSATVTGLTAGTTYMISVVGVLGTGDDQKDSKSEDAPAAVRTLSAVSTAEAPFMVSTGEQVDIRVSSLVNPSVSLAATYDDMAVDAVRGNMMFEFEVTPGNDAVSVEHIDDADMDHSDDLIRLVGKAEGSYTVTVTATSGDLTLRSTLPVKILENHTPIFRITESTVDWDIDNVGTAFEIDVMASFVSDQISDADAGACSENASDDVNCDHTLTFTLSGGAGYLHITDANSETGLITVGSRSDRTLAAVEDGRQFELTVTATDQSGEKDTMKIFVDVIEGNDKPFKKRDARDMYLTPLSAHNGGGFRSVNVAGSFEDREGDDLCYEITASSLTDGDATLADANLEGASECMNANLTIRMRLPSVDPDSDDFALLGRYGTDTISVDVAAFQRGDAEKTMTSSVKISVDLVYGPNVGPSIRTVANVTGSTTFLATGSHKIDEGQDIRLTFTADDAQPTGDTLCWSSRGNCTPCKGSEPGAYRPSGWPRPIDIEKRNSNTGAGPVSHEYDLVIRGTERVRIPWTGRFTTRVNTDFERSGGTYTINLCATDLSGATNRLRFEVKVEDVEEAPMFTDDFDPLYMVVGDYSQEVDIARLASDGDGKDDIVDYDANCIGGCGPIKISEEDGIVTVTPTENEIGKADTVDSQTVEVEVSAEDSTGKIAYSSFMVTVKDRNTSPTFQNGLAGIDYTVAENSGSGTKVGSPLAVADADEGDALSAAVSGTKMFSASVVKTSDADADEDTYGVQVAVALPRGTKLDFEAPINSYDFAVVVEDKYGGASSIDVRVDVTDLNEAPTKTEDDIPDQKILVGVTECNISAGDHFRDPDHRDQQAGLYVEATTTRPGDASVSVQDNDLICISGINVGSGSGRVKVTATDRDDKSVSKTFRVQVEANMAPTVAMEIEDMEIQEHGRTADIDLNAHFDDGDADYDEELMFSFEIDAASIATGALIDGDMLRVYGDSMGEAMVTVKATDQNEQYVTDTFMVEVERNSAPVGDPTALADVMTRLGLTMDPIDARSVFTDEGDTLKFYVSTGNPDVATVALKYDAEGGAWIVVHVHSVGITTATMTATDSVGQEAMVSFTIDVGARNDPPTVANPIADVSVESGASMDIALADVFSDEGDLDISVANENETIADVIYRASSNSIRVYGNDVGTTTVTVTATDNIGQTVYDMFDAMVVEPAPVEPPNAAPIVAGSLENQTVTVGEPITVSITGVFSDPDGDELMYTATSSDDNVASLNLSGENLEISGVHAGTAIFSITATDPKGLNVIGTFDVIVETVPAAVGSIANQNLQIGGESLGLNIADYFFDEDGDVLSYAITTSGNAATVTNVSADLTLTPYTRGSTSVTITASDPKGRSASQSFSIAVSDSEIKNVANQALAGHARAALSSVSVAISSRLESSRSDTGFSFGRFLPSLAQNNMSDGEISARNGVMGFGENRTQGQSNSAMTNASWKQAQMPTSIGSHGQGSPFSLDSLVSSRNFSRTLNGNGGIGSWSVWGTADAQNFEGEGYDGSANSLFLGVDVQSTECLLFGVTVSRNTAESDYSWGTATQTLDTSLTTVLPYFSYEPLDGKSSVWGVFGRGSGDAESTVVNAAAQTSDLSLNLGMFGGRREFAKAGSLTLALRGDVAFANMETASGNGAVDDLSAGVNRVRAGVEGSFTMDTGNGGSVTPFGELSFRNDGGDGLTGSGVEVSGGVRVDANAFTLEARGRTTATHSAEDFSESGVSLMIAIAPSNDGSGFSFSVAPSYGRTSTGNSPIWAETATLGATPFGAVSQLRSPMGMSVESKLGYGFHISQNRFMVTPFVDVRTLGSDGVTTLIGTELTQLISSSRQIDVQMFIGRSESGYSAASNEFGLNARISF